MLRKILYFSLLLSLFNTNALALETIYTGLQASQFNYEGDFIEGEPAALTFRLGGYLDKGTAIEARFGFGLEGYDDTVSGVSFEVEPFLGLYGLYHIGWGSNASFYGILGFTNGEIKLSTATTDTRETNVSYGVGLNIANFNFEYIQYFHDDLYDVTAISFGYVSQF
jgi:hypothetical protein